MDISDGISRTYDLMPQPCVSHLFCISFEVRRAPIGIC